MVAFTFLQYVYNFYCNNFDCAQFTLRTSVQVACCLDIGFRHMFSALGCVVFGWYIHCAVKFSLCVYADASPGVRSLVGGESSKSLVVHLLVSALRWFGGGGLFVISITFVLVLTIQ